jgi:OTU domain-containing protein 6
MKVRHEAEVKALSDGGTEEEEEVGATIESSVLASVVQLSPAQVAAAAEEERQRIIKEKLGLKREKARAKERAKEQDIKDENANAGPAPRDVEMQIIQSKLPEGWRMEEVAADGHCLYRAIAAQHSDSSSYAHIRTYCIMHTD